MTEAPDFRMHPDTAHDTAPCRPWGFWMSTVFGIASVIAWLACQWLALIAVFLWLGISVNSGAAELDTMATHGFTIAAVTIGSAPAAILVLMAAAKLARCSVADYLALRWPDRTHLLIGIACIAVLLPLGDLSSYLTGRDLVPPFVVDAYRTARDSGHIVTLAIALVVAAPLMEELLFRGFLFPGYAGSLLGVTGTVLLTSAAWAAMHVQYEWFYIFQIFILGCVFGWLRWRSGSTTLTLILHGLVNLTALLQVAYLVGR